MRISPDGARVALVIGLAADPSRPSDIWIYDLETGNLRQLTFGPLDADGPVWTPDSASLYFRSPIDEDEDQMGVYRVGVDGGEPEQVALSEDFPFALPWSLSPDGRVLALIHAYDFRGDVDIAVLRLSGDVEFDRLLSESQIEGQPAFAPNGEWLAYNEQDIGGLPEINLRPFPDVARGRYPVGEGVESVFSRDGSEFYFGTPKASRSPRSLMSRR